MHVRVALLVLFSILIVPLIHPQENPDREQKRKTLLVLMGLASVLTLLLKVLKLLAN